MESATILSSPTTLELCARFAMHGTTALKCICMSDSEYHRLQSSVEAWCCSLCFKTALPFHDSSTLNSTVSSTSNSCSSSLFFPHESVLTGIVLLCIPTVAVYCPKLIFSVPMLLLFTQMFMLLPKPGWMDPYLTLSCLSLTILSSVVTETGISWFGFNSLVSVH